MYRRILKGATLASLALAVAWLSGDSPAHSTGHEAKLDPMLRMTLDHPVTPDVTRLVAVPEAEGMIDVVLQARRDVSDVVRALGGSTQTVLGDGAVITATLPRSAVRRLAADDDVLAIDASKVLRNMAERIPDLHSGAEEAPPLAVSVNEIGAPQVWALKDARGLPMRGAGVLMGVVDSGIDLKHGDFKTAAGVSRVVVLWDQQVAGSGPAGTAFKYGLECTHPMITAGACGSRDIDGHGTHVAGIAAGNGLSNAPAKHIGVAPDADLIVVRRGASTATTNAAIDAWTYMVLRAKQLGLPIVINNSWGHGLGAKDGSDPMERALDLLAGPGVVFVNAVGNSGHLRAHAEGTLRQGTSIGLPFTIKTPTQQNLAIASIWYRGADSVGVAVKTSGGQILGPVPKGSQRSWSSGDGTQVIIDATRALYAGNGDNQALVVITRQAPPLPATWELVLSGDQMVTSAGRFDEWMASSLSGLGEEEFTSAAATLSQSLGEPSTAKRTISVGNYVSSRCFTSIDTGQYCMSGISASGGAHPSTSRGPTRDGREKPELAAPGATIVSALSADGPERQPGSPVSFLRTPDDKHAAQIGTSMAAPHVAGVIALMLQKHPALTPEEARLALQTSARKDTHTGTVWNGQWGRGKLDALGAVNAVTAPVVRATPPGLVTPAASTQLPGMTVALVWSNPVGATQIHLQVTPANNDGPAINLIRNAETTFNVEAPLLGTGPYVLLPGMTYRWRVRASNEHSAIDDKHASWSEWSEERAFRTPVRSGDRIVAVAPAADALTPLTPQTLRWSNPDTDVFYYEVQVSPDPSFDTNPATATASVWTNLVHAGLSTPPNAWVTPALAPGVSYHWRVRPRVQGDGVPVAWSPTFRFRTE